MCTQGQSKSVFRVLNMVNLLFISSQKSKTVLHYLEVAVGLALKYCSVWILGQVAKKIIW